MGGRTLRSERAKTRLLDFVRLSLPLVTAVLIAACVTSASKPRAVSLSAVRKLRGPLTFGQVERRFGRAMQAHGPARWYRCSDRDGMALWFWFQRPKDHQEWNSIGEIGVSYITLSPADDPDTQEIVWPTSATGRDANLTLKNLYKGLR